MTHHKEPFGGFAERARTQLSTGQPPSPELLSMQQLDMVTAIHRLGDRIPLVINALQKLHDAIPGLLEAAVLGRMTLAGWTDLAMLLEQPANALTEAAQLCRKQAVPAPEGDS